jgi:hypothetical protein
MQTLAVPALRQSIASQMACEYSYGLVQVRGLRPPDTLESVRGTDIHAILAPYAAHCAQRKVPADYAYLDSMLEAATPEVADILETCRDHLTIDWENFYGAEVSMGLDRELRPTFSFDHDGNMVPISPIWKDEGSGESPEYCLIADQILMFAGGKAAAVDDYKSHPRAFPADTFQGKLYCLAVMMHMPDLEEVTFRLRFVRYANVITEHKYYRSDVPQMMKDVHRMRQRQIELHIRAQAGDHLTAHGGTHCVYCPCVLDPKHIPCPIYQLNPMTNLKPEERLNWRLVHDAMNRANNLAMKQYVDGTAESIKSIDPNGKSYTFGPVPKEKTTFPLFTADGGGGYAMPIVDALLEWADVNPDDLIPRKGSRPWFLNLRIGSTQLKQYLKAGKRELIHNNIKDLAEVTVKPELRITRDAEVDDGTGEEYREYGDDE